MPEARIILSEAVIYLATSSKSNSAYEAISAALQKVAESGPLPVPLALRNTPTQMMKNMGYGSGYQYSHAYEGNFAQQEFMPDEVAGTAFYHPGDNKHEKDIEAKMKYWWGEKYQ